MRTRLARQSRPVLEAPTAGVCRFCGCSEFDPCPPDSCAWLDDTQTICSSCEAAAIAERSSWYENRPGRRHAGQIFDAFHAGFAQAWFAAAGQNPYGPRKHPTLFKYFQFGQQAGRKARSIHQHYQGPIVNTPQARQRERRLERSMRHHHRKAS